MSLPPPTRYDILCPTIKAMGHPLRLQIIEMLSLEPLCVSNISMITKTEISVVSHHLTILKKAGVITSEKRGKEQLYRLLTPCINEFIGCIENIVIKRADETFKETKKAFRKKCLCHQETI